MTIEPKSVITWRRWPLPDHARESSRRTVLGDEVGILVVCLPPFA